FEVAGEHFALADMVGSADDALALHALDDARGAVIADLQVTLHEAGRSLPFPTDNGDRLVVELVAALGFVAAGKPRGGLLLARDVLDIGRAALLFKEPDHRFDLGIAHERAVNAGDPAALGHVEHVALAEELLGALLAQDRPAVDLRGDVEADARREIGLDGAGDDVDRRALRR